MREGRGYWHLVHDGGQRRRIRVVRWTTDDHVLTVHVVALGLDVAPEVLLHKPYALEVDCFSLGVIAFILSVPCIPPCARARVLDRVSFPFVDATT